MPLFPGCYVEEQHTPARHPARDAGSSSWHKRNNNGDSLPQIFLDTASGRGMTQGVTPHSDAGSSSWHKRNSNSDSPPRIFLDTTSECGMTKGVTPHAMRGPERGRKGSVFCKCFCRYFLDSTSMCGMTKAGIPGSRIGVRDDQITASGYGMTKARSHSGLWEKAERKMTERDERGKKMFEPGRISRRARDSKACRTAAAKRARRVLFPRTSQSFFSFRTSAGSFLLAFPFLLREKKREILDARAVRPYWPGRYCRRFSLDINSGYILDTASRTVSPRT